IERAGHKLTVEVPAEPMIVEGDAARLTQVLSNLLSNAVRYSARPGSISLTATRDNHAAVITIKDQGVGMSKESLAHVFEMFYQGSNGQREYSGGLGIGLTLAKTLVEMHGGTLSAWSEGENRGSEFTIRLPLMSHPDLQGALPINEEKQSIGADH